MTRIYLIRHAEAEGNWRRLFQGHYDGVVSEKGERQLARLARRFETVCLDAVYASPLKRAVQTARAINPDGRRPVIVEDGIMEINGGEFEGVLFSELPRMFPQEFALWENAPAQFSAPGGESMIQVYERMRDTIGRIARENAGKTVAVASHGCAIRNYLCYAHGWPLSRIHEIPWCDNTAVNLVEYDDAFQPRLVYFNDSSHLSEEDSTFATQTWWKTRPSALHSN